MTDYKDIAVDLMPDGKLVSETVFETLKRVMGGVDNDVFARFSDAEKYKYQYLYTNNREEIYVLDRSGRDREIKTPTEILGEPLMEAIEQGYTPWFKGDPSPNGEVYAYLYNGRKALGGKSLNSWDWDWGDYTNIIAYKKVEPSIESRILSEKIGNDPVHYPKHYQTIDNIESIELIAAALTAEEWRGFCLGNILEYRFRAGKKDALQQDIEKANEYESLFEKHKNLNREER